MISDFQFPIEDLASTHTPIVDGGESSGSPAASNRVKPDDSFVIPCAPGRPQRAALLAEGVLHESKRRSLPQLARLSCDRFLKLLGDDIPCARRHANYLETLTFEALTARRDQLLKEKGGAQ